MDIYTIKKLMSDPDFRRINRVKSRLSWGLSFFVLAMYVVYISLLGWNPELFARKLGDDTSINVGIVAGMAVILVSILVTGVYTWIANGQLEDETRLVMDRLSKGE